MKIIVLTVSLVCILLLVMDVQTIPLHASSNPANLQIRLPPALDVHFGTSLKSGIKQESVPPNGRKRSKLVLTRASSNQEKDKVTDTFLKSVLKFYEDIEQEKTLYWRVENMDLIPMGSYHINSELKSEHVYIVIKYESSGEIKYKNTTKIKPKNYLYTIYYWIGECVREEDRAGGVAFFALLMSAEMPHSAIRVRRETDGYESKAFKALTKRETYENGNTEEPEEFSRNRKRLFLVGGKNKTYVREVERKLIYLLKDCTCFVFVSRKVYVSCGSGASKLHEKRAKKLAKIVMEKRGLDVDEEIKIHKINEIFAGGLNEEEEDDLHAFFRTFENEREENEKHRDVQLIRIYEDYTGMMKEEPYLEHKQLRVEQLNTNDCFIVDSQSNAGLFVWIGAGADMLLRAASAHQAELYLRKKGYHYATPITFIDEGDLPPDTWITDIVPLAKPENNDDDVPQPLMCG